MRYQFGKQCMRGLVLGLVYFFILAVPVMAFPPDENGPCHGPGMAFPPAFGIWRDPSVIRDLGLTDQQITKLKETEFTFREKQLDLKSRIGKLHLEMDKAFSADTVNDKAIIQLAKQTADEQGQMFVQMIESQLALANILTPDQMKKLKRMEMPSRPHKMCGMGKRHEMPDSKSGPPEHMKDEP